MSAWQLLYFCTYTQSRAAPWSTTQRSRSASRNRRGSRREKKKKPRFPTHLTVNFEFQQEAKRKEAQRLEDENFGTHLAGRIRTFMWNLMEYPETSKYAQVGCMGNAFVGNARVCAGVEIEPNSRFLRHIGKETGRGWQWHIGSQVLYSGAHPSVRPPLSLSLSLPLKVEN